MRKRWAPRALKDYKEFQRTSKAAAAKIDELLDDIERDPSSLSGIGHPEYLKHERCWSRKINEKDRLMYNVIDDVIHIYRCRKHYGDK